jgi:anti-sigma factor ChrR (cupin superfamily)
MKKRRCPQSDLAPGAALGTLTVPEQRTFQDHLEGCPACRRELQSLTAVIGQFAAWPADVVRPPRSLWDRISVRIAAESRMPPSPVAVSPWREAEWEEVAPGISCKLLATDPIRSRVSMLVRLQPNTAYPPHRHAGVEELHLLDGELWIDDRKLYPGDYNRGEPGTSDARVWSETGCTCVLITSPQDRLG